jgi:hypothetical protein
MNAPVQDLVVTLKDLDPTPLATAQEHQRRLEGFLGWSQPSDSVFAGLDWESGRREEQGEAAWLSPLLAGRGSNWRPEPAIGYPDGRSLLLLGCCRPSPSELEPQNAGWFYPTLRSQPRRA